MPNEKQIMQSARAFFSKFNWTDPVAVTLTMKSRIYESGMLVTANTNDHSQNLHHFLNVLNKQIYRGLARKGWLMTVVSVRERGAFDRSHYHLMIDKPPHLAFQQFANAIRSVWKKTTWGRAKIDVSRDGGERWINYMTKLRTKDCYDEAIDWHNTYNAATPLASLEVPLKIRVRRRSDRELFELVKRYASYRGSAFQLKPNANGACEASEIYPNEVKVIQ